MGLIIYIYRCYRLVFYSRLFFLLHLGAGGAGCVEVCSPSCCGWAVRCLILRRWSIAVMVVLWAVGSPCPAGRWISVFCTGWASSYGFSGQASPCHCSRGCGPIRSTACSSPARWASSCCSPRWWAPWWRGDGHWSLWGVNFCSAFSLRWLLFYLLARLAVSAGFFFRFFLLKCRLLFCFLRIAFFAVSFAKRNGWWCSLDVESFFRCCVVCAQFFFHFM